MESEHRRYIGRVREPWLRGRHGLAQAAANKERESKRFPLHFDLRPRNNVKGACRVAYVARPKLSQDADACLLSTGHAVTLASSSLCRAVLLILLIPVAYSYITCISVNLGSDWRCANLDKFQGRFASGPTECSRHIAILSLEHV